MWQPIWTDEILHFSIGSINQPKEAVNLLLYSLEDINHGQTGFYIFLDYLFLKFLGASQILLRMPNLIGVILIIVMLQKIFLVYNLTFLKKQSLILIIFSSASLFQAASTARPYFLLSATVFSIYLIYLLKFVFQKNYKLLDIIVTLIGVLFHPYFIVYMLVFHLIFAKKKFFASFTLIQISAIFLYLFLYIFTFGKGRPDFSNFQVLLWIGDGLNLPLKFIASHLTLFNQTQLNFLSEPQIILIGTTFLTLTILVLLTVFKSRGNKNRHIFYLTILVLMLISIFISFISFWNNYWIIPRQWIGSQPLIAFVIFLIFDQSKIEHTQLSVGGVALKKLFISIYITFFALMAFQYHFQYQQIKVWREETLQNYEMCEVLNLTQLNSEVDLSRLVHCNINLGGQVWSSFYSVYAGYGGIK